VLHRVRLRRCGERETHNLGRDEVAGFAHVSDGMPMKNRTDATVYYLLFASQKPVAKKIVGDIFKKHADRRR
jgi:hypothetical protein